MKPATPELVVREPVKGEALTLRHCDLPAGGLALVDSAGAVVAADRLGSVLARWLLALDGAPFPVEYDAGFVALPPSTVLA